MVRGKIYPSIKLVLHVAVPSLQDDITIELINAQLTSLSAGGASGESQLTENISIHFGRPIYTYTPQGGGTPIVTAVPHCP